MACFPYSPQPYRARKRVLKPIHWNLLTNKNKKIMKESLKNRVDEINSQLEKAGFSEKSLKNLNREGIEGNILPKSGTFDSFKIAGKGNFMHARVTVAGSDDSISVSNLKIVAPLKGDEVEFREIMRDDSALKGGKYLVGRAINPQFTSFSPVELIAHLEGKKFEAEEIEVLTLPVKTDATGAVVKQTNPKKSDLAVKKAYRVTLVD